MGWNNVLLNWIQSICLVNGKPTIQWQARLVTLSLVSSTRSLEGGRPPKKHSLGQNVTWDSEKPSGRDPRQIIVYTYFRVDQDYQKILAFNLEPVSSVAKYDKRGFSAICLHLLVASLKACCDRPRKSALPFIAAGVWFVWGTEQPSVVAVGWMRRPRDKSMKGRSELIWVVWVCVCL